MPLVLGFAGLLGMVLLLTSAITGASFTDILAGKAGDLYREHEATAAAANSTSPAASATAGPTPTPGSAPRGSSTPKASWNPLHKPVADWIIPILEWASHHGWNGTLLSGERTPAEQQLAAEHYGLGHYPNGPLASNHVKGTGKGAVDVTQPAQLARVLLGYHGRRKLTWGGPVIGDNAHFSPDGH